MSGNDLSALLYPNRTHGIGYSWVNDHLYVECSHPEACTEEDPAPYTDGETRATHVNNG